MKSKNFSINESILVEDLVMDVLFEGGSHLVVAFKCFHFRFYCLTVLIIALIRWKKIKTEWRIGLIGLGVISGNII